jgi:hypothetical protein
MPHDSSDVVIAGAGACGSLIAKELASQALFVFMLEPLIKNHTPLASLFSASILSKIEGPFLSGNTKSAQTEIIVKREPRGAA